MVIKTTKKGTSVICSLCETANTSVPFCFTDRPLSARIHRGPTEPAIRRQRQRREPAGTDGGTPRQAGRVKAGREMHEKISRLMNRSRALNTDLISRGNGISKHASLRRTFSALRPVAPSRSPVTFHRHDYLAARWLAVNVELHFSFLF